MKRIVRLTESDLARIVRRVVNEATESSMSVAAGAGTAVDKAIAKEIYDSQGYIYDDLKMLYNALKKIKDENQYWRVNHELYVIVDGDYSGITDYINNFAAGLELTKYGIYSAIEAVAGKKVAAELNTEHTWGDQFYGKGG